MTGSKASARRRKPATFTENEQAFTVHFQGIDYIVESEYYSPERALERTPDIYYGTQIRYEIEDDNIRAEIKIGVNYGGYAPEFYVGRIFADIAFDGKEITLENYKFSLCDCWGRCEHLD